MTSITQDKMDAYTELLADTLPVDIPATLTQIFTDLGITVRQTFTDGQVVRSGDDIAVADRTWYVRQGGVWKELSIRADSNSRQYNDEQVYGWLDSGTLVLWQSSEGEW